MKIAFVTDLFPTVSNTFVINQITGLIDLGHDVHIHASKAGDFAGAHPVVREYRLEERMRHIPIPRNWGSRALTAAAWLARPGSWSGSSLEALNFRRFGRDALSLSVLYTNLSLLQSGPYDIIHCQFAKLGPVALPVARHTNTPLVVAARGADLTRHLLRLRSLYEDLFDRAQLFLPVSRSLASILLENGCPPEKVVVHHSAIELERFEFRERRLEREEPVRLLFIGRLTEKKGLSYGLEALATLLQQGRRVELSIIGSGEEEGPLRGLSKDLGIEDSVHWLGRKTQDQVLEHLATSHLLLAPSVTAADGDQEGIPNVLKEGMATGLPVVSTFHSGIPELVEDGVSGYLAPERDTPALAEALARLIDHPECWPSFGRAGRRRVEAEYDNVRLNRELEHLYLELQA